MSDRLKKYLKKLKAQQSGEEPESTSIEDDLKKISQYSQEGRFTSPYIHTPEKIEVNGQITEAPRKREADKFTKGFLQGFSTPVLGAYEELSQSGKEFKQGDITGGIADLLKGTLHTAITPITAPLGGTLGAIKESGQIGGEVAKGLENVLNLPFDAIKQGSELVKQSLDAIGIDTSDSETTKKYNDLVIEVGGLLALGVGHSKAKQYVDSKIPEVKITKDPEVVIKPQETKPVENVTQEKLPLDMVETPKIPEADFSQPPVVDFNTRLYDINKIAVKNILNDDPSLSSNARLVSKRLTAMKEQGKLPNKVSLESIKSIIEEWKSERPKPPIQEIKQTPSDLGLQIPKEENSTIAISFDKKAKWDIEDTLRNKPEFLPYVKDLKTGKEVAETLNSLYWKQRRGEKLPEIKDPEISFDFGENVKGEVKPETKVEETTSIKNEIVNKEREYRGLEPLENEIVRDWGTVGKDAMDKIKSGSVDPIKLTKELSDNPRPITDTESAILTYDRLRIKEEHRKLIEENKPENGQRILDLEEQYNLNDIASKQVGTELGRALGIRRMEIRDDYSLAPLVQRARIANKGEVVPEEIRVKLESYSKEIANKQKLFEQEKAKNELLEAEKILLQEQLKERTQRRTVKKEQLDTEYNNLLKEFASTMQLNALVDPKQIQLMTKMALNRMQKGGLTIEQVVDQVYQATKQYVKDLTLEDVRNAIIGSGRFTKLTEGELKKRIAEIKRAEGSNQAKLQKAYKTRLENRRKEYEQMLETGNFERTPRRKTQMTPELSKLKDEVDVLKQHVDREIRLLELKNRTKTEKVKDTTIDIANIPRTVKASFDLSAPFRQGVIFLASHPVISFRKGGAFREMFRYFGSDKALRELQRTIEESPNASLYIKSKLYLANEKTNIGRVSGREEAFMSTLAERIPFFGTGIKASNRAYAGFLDKLRMDVFDYYAEQFMKSGLRFDKDPKVYKDLAKLVNNATGRGTLGGFEKSASALSIGIFSPRLIASRLWFLNPVNYFSSKLSPQVRKLLWKDALKFIGMGTATVSLAKLAGAEVEIDPRSSDFGKIKIGNTRIDVWGGFQQYGVFFTRLGTGQMKQSSGEVIELDGKKFPFSTRKDLVIRFAEQKLSPSAGFFRDLLSNKSFMGDDFKLEEQALDLMTPLYLKDLYEAAQEDGIEGAMLTLPAVFGFGVQTYKPKKPRIQY